MTDAVVVVARSMLAPAPLAVLALALPAGVDARPGGVRQEAVARLGVDAVPPLAAVLGLAGEHGAAAATPLRAATLPIAACEGLEVLGAIRREPVPVPAQPSGVPRLRCKRQRRC